MRLAELMGTLSLAADAGMGMPAEHGLRSATVAVALGEVAGIDAAALRDAFYLALLRYAGCTADADIAADVMGDEVAVRGALYGADWGSPFDLLPRITRAVSAGRGRLAGAAATLRTLAKLPLLLDTGLAHCEVADRLAERVGFDAPFRAALLHTFERWDGRGYPSKLRGDAIARSMRLAQIAEEIEIGHRLGGIDAARALVRERAGHGIDPRLAEAFERRAAQVCAPLDAASAWVAALEAEPTPFRSLDDALLDEALRAMADFADLKSRFTRSHSRGVADLATRAATEMRLATAECKATERAGWVHDIGRVSVTTAVWDKAGPLTDNERERIRMHTYVGERILARATSLKSVIEIATLAHERVDGSGYHRRLPGSACVAPARLLAAADVYHALLEARPHRPAFAPGRAASMLGDMAKRGALCPDAVRSVLAVSGHRRPRVERPASVTDRELEVLRLVARGLTNKEIANALDISAKTAGHHVQHIFEKLGVTTRAGATMFAMQRGLVE